MLMFDSYFVNLTLLQELEALRSQVQSQSAELNQMKMERQELLRRAEAGVRISCKSDITVVMFSQLTSITRFPQSSNPENDRSIDAAKMAELESRLAAELTETERLRVRGMTWISFFHVFCCYCLWALRVLSAQAEAKSLKESQAELEQQLASSTSSVAILQTEKAKLQTEVQESKKEQDDLLMLLADQDQKIFSLKQRLKDLGETVRVQLETRVASVVPSYWLWSLHAQVEDEDDLDAKDQTDDDEEEDEEEED